MKKIFCKTKIVLIVLVLIISFGLFTKVEAAYTDKLKVGDKLEFTGVSWTIYTSKAAARELDKKNKDKNYVRNEDIINIEEIDGNVLKIGKNKYIYYGSTADRFFREADQEDTTKIEKLHLTEETNLITVKDGITRVKYNTSDVVNKRKMNGNDSKEVCLYYAKRMMGNDNIKLNKEVKSNGIYKYILAEINSGRPILMKVKGKNENDKAWRYVLIYAYNNDVKVNTRKKFYIIDPLTGEYSNLKNYDIIVSKEYKYEYITINGKHKNEITVPINEGGTVKGNKYTDSKGHTFTLYRQGNYKQKYWGGTIATHGCGPSSCAILVTGFGYNETPATIVQKNGNWAGSFGRMVKYFQAKGFNVEAKYSYSASNNYILNKLKAGYKVLVHVQKGYIGNYYYSGHYYTILDVNTKTNKVFVGDPGPTSLTRGNNKGGGNNGWYDIDDLTGKVNLIFIKK